MGRWRGKPFLGLCTPYFASNSALEQLRGLSFSVVINFTAFVHSQLAILFTSTFSSSNSSWSIALFLVNLLIFNEVVLFSLNNGFVHSQNSEFGMSSFALSWLSAVAFVLRTSQPFGDVQPAELCTQEWLRLSETCTETELLYTDFIPLEFVLSSLNNGSVFCSFLSAPSGSR